MTDIVERLRDHAATSSYLAECRPRGLICEAAAEIERLRAEVHKLSTTCGHCGDLERAWTEAAVARREGIEALATRFERMTDHTTAALVRSVGGALLSDDSHD